MNIFYFYLVLLLLWSLDATASKEAFLSYCQNVKNRSEAVCHCSYKESTEAPIRKARAQRNYERVKKPLVNVISQARKQLSEDSTISDDLVNEICTLRDAYLQYRDDVIAAEKNKQGIGKPLDRKQEAAFQRSLSREIKQDFSERGRVVQDRVHALLQEHKVSTPSYRLITGRGEPCKTQRKLSDVEENFVKRMEELSPDTLAKQTTLWLSEGESGYDQIGRLQYRSCQKASR